MYTCAYIGVSCAYHTLCIAQLVVVHYGGTSLLWIPLGQHKYPD